MEQIWDNNDWLESANHWVTKQLKLQKINSIGRLKPVSGWGLGHVLKQPTEQGDVYFKATAKLPLFSNEALLSRYLHSINMPTPEVLAIEETHQYQLTKDFGGGLAEDSSATLWADAFEQFAQLQLDSLSYLKDFNKQGCLNRPISDVAAQLQLLIEHPQLQSLLDSEIILATEKAIAKLSHNIDELSQLEIGETLVHGDLHIENVAMSDDQCIFFDWSDACISHPFIDGTYLYRMPDSQDKTQIIDAYLKPWKQHYQPQQVEQAWQLCEHVCYAHQAISYASMMLHLSPEARVELNTAFQNALSASLRSNRQTVKSTTCVRSKFCGMVSGILHTLSLIQIKAGEAL
ncbi:aminoglycoside phosphotransferase family protein [Parashewanella curva]|uniref:Aminoglycoside phosphotransferase family protein n=1 Tax=Parashewanella curva TaxID=2338552 RepID=A0A3L8PT99_9GAMM|nr:phosphotransferase [Parashewanella curva]RLV58049.1 aminoglycoside phosphotransferase family protein [Parashewanella curva]